MLWKLKLLFPPPKVSYCPHANRFHDDLAHLRAVWRKLTQAKNMLAVYILTFHTLDVVSIFPGNIEHRLLVFFKVLWRLEIPLNWQHYEITKYSSQHQ